MFVNGNRGILLVPAFFFKLYKVDGLRENYSVLEVEYSTETRSYIRKYNFSKSQVINILLSGKILKKRVDDISNIRSGTIVQFE